MEESFSRGGERAWSWDSRKEGVIEASGRLFFPLAAGGYGGGTYDTDDYTGTVAAQKALMKWFEDALYLSSNRGFTRYNYPLLAGNPTVVDISNRAGDASALEEWLSNLILYRLNEAKRFPEMQKRLDVMGARLAKLGVEVSPYVTDGPSVVVDLVENGMWVSAVNSGYGVNQSVATVVLGSLSEEGALVMIEEPETHLHPRYQRTMAEILLGMAQEGKQVLITSHSDHILQTLAELAERDGLGEDDVRVYHFEKQGRETQPTRVDLSDRETMAKLFA